MKPANRPWGRATDLAQFKALHDILMGSAYRQPRFAPGPTDVIISPFAKSGTTWLQHIAHGLRARGDMNFAEISFVVPCLDYPHPLGLDLNAPQQYQPRLFMTHSNWHDVPKGARYICAFRNPKDVIVSYYRMLENWFFAPGVIALDDFARFFLPVNDELDDWWLHMVSWWEQRDAPEVLLLTYEDMLDDLVGTVRRIAGVMGVALSEELLAVVVRQSSRDFMLAHAEQFDERGLRRLAEQEIGLPFASDATKVTPGADKARYRLSPEVVAAFDAVWRSQVEPRTGWSDYDDLRRAVRLHNSATAVRRESRS